MCILWAMHYTFAFRLLFGIFAVSLGVSIPAYSKNWPQYRGPDLDGTTTDKITNLKWPGSGPKQLWKSETNTGFSSFCVADGKTYTLVRRELDGIDREICLALDANTGKELWIAELALARYGHDGGNSGARGNKGGDGPRSTPTFHNGHVYVVDADLTVFCFQAADGKAVWKRSLLKEHNGKNIKWKNAASPVIDGDRLYVGGGGRGQAFLALDPKDGSVIWKSGNDTITHATPAVATLHGVRQVVFFTTKGLRGIQADNGKELWHYPFDFKVSTAASPVVFGDIVYCSAGYGVGAGACRISKGNDGWTAKEIWRKPNKLQNHWSTPVCRDGYLYGIYGFKEYGDAPLACVDIRTGEQKWEHRGFGPGHLILAGDHLLVLGDAGQLVVVKPDSSAYKELTRAKVLDGKCWTTPVLSGGRVYARSTREGVCLDVSG